MLISYDGQKIFIICQGESFDYYRLEILDTAMPVPANRTVNDLAFSSDGKAIFAACDEGLNVFSIDSPIFLTYQYNITTNGPAKLVVLSDDNKIAFVATENELQVINITTRGLINNLMDIVIDMLVLLPNHKLLTSIEYSDDNTVVAKLVDVSNPMSPNIVPMQVQIDSFSDGLKVNSFATSKEHLFWMMADSVHILRISESMQVTELFNFTVEFIIFTGTASNDGQNLYQCKRQDKSFLYKLYID